VKADFLSRYTPRLISPQVLENIFVQRQELAQELVDRIRESVLTSAKHHTLLTGPRGIGKTHLVSLVYHRICKMDDLRYRILIAWLSEEEWSVTSFLDLLLCILEALQEESNNSKGEQLYPLTERIESLYEMPVEAAESAGVALLKEFIGNSPNGDRSASRTLLLLVENLDDLFAGLGKDGQKQLRTFLEENSCIVLGTAQSYFKDVNQKNSPFYGFFCHEELKELKADDATQLLANIAKHNKNHELASFIQTQTGRDRIKAVHFLAGGNHRLYVIFSEFLTDHKSLDQLVDAFMRTLDDLTPYYQERMRFLSPQQRKIIDFLCDHRHPVPVKEIAQRCFMTHQTASSQLKKLLEMGYVRSEPIGRESYYELREPLMRFCLEVKKQRGEPIQLFVDFLRFWYTHEELQQRLRRLPPDAALEREYVRQALRATEEDEEDPRVAAYWKEYKAYIKNKEFANALQVTEKLVAVRGHPKDWLVKGYCLYLQERYDEALAGLDKVIELDSNEVRAWSMRAVVLYELQRKEEAIASFDKVIELKPNDKLVWDMRGVLLEQLRNYDEALVSFDKSIELNPNDERVWRMRGAILGLLENYDEALVSLDKSIKLDPNYAPAWNMRGLTMALLGCYEEAITSWDKAIALADQSEDIFLYRAEALLALNRWDEGIATLDEALSRFAHADELGIGDTAVIICPLFNSIKDTAAWRSRIKTLIELYDKHQVLSALGQGLVRSIPELSSEMVSDKATQIWLEVWRELVGDRPEFQISLRLLNAAVRYRETKGDRRVLLELPIEERNLLKQLLGLDKP
jgi:tetratricopeptide (TPR) repeat protein